ncbi:hypothetical protein ZWY2020_021043 [Hordeum vulgare]|nr:hypothetical protein ZWY2020_021043 [Hordeum vulgare]
MVNGRNSQHGPTDSAELLHTDPTPLGLLPPHSLLAGSLYANSSPHSCASASPMASAPPVARKVPHELAEHGDVRVDSYYWLRDDSRSDPAVLAHLRAENYYTSALMSDDTDVPLRKGRYYYYERTLTGKEYVQHCRRLVPTDGHITVFDAMPVGLDAPDEHIVLMRIGKYVGQPLKGVTSEIEWAGDDYLVYVTMDSLHRPDKVCLHKLGSDQSNDMCLYYEKMTCFHLVFKLLKASNIYLLDQKAKHKLYIPPRHLQTEQAACSFDTRLYGIDTAASHRGNHFYIKRLSEEFYNSELVACPSNNVAEAIVLLPHRESVKIQDFQLFENHIAVYERENGLPKITVYGLPASGEAFGKLQGGREIDFVDPVYAVEPEESQFHSSIIRFHYSSLKTPPSVFDYDMDSGVSVLKKINTVLGGFDSSNYVLERKWAAASDGTQIPISIIYRKDLVQLDGSDPMLLSGFGSYEICIDPSFSGSIFSLVDRGFVHAIAHVRGGGEMGRKWYEDGKLLKKKNTFTDFIACAEHLMKSKYCSKEKLCINGKSAGGLLMGAVLNMRPDLFKAATVEVPFVDALTTMLDTTIPLTTAEWEEEEYYYYMKSYSPVDNVKAQEYPHILVTAGLNDPCVMYSEPAKFVAKLRELKRDDNLLLFKCEEGAGHNSKSGRFEKLREDAFTYAFLLKALGMTNTA